MILTEADFVGSRFSALGQTSNRWKEEYRSDKPSKWGSVARKILTTDHRRDVRSIGPILTDIRSKIVDTGRHLLTWDEIDREVRERRGE